MGSPLLSVYGVVTLLFDKDGVNPFFCLQKTLKFQRFQIMKNAQLKKLFYILNILLLLYIFNTNLYYLIF